MTDQTPAAINSDPATEPVPVTDAPTVHGEATQVYTPSGDNLTVHGDGVDFTDIWDSEEFGGALQNEAAMQDGGEAISLEEKNLMADRHEPFAITDIYEKRDAQNGPCWVISFIPQMGDGQERTMFLSCHDQRDAACGAIKRIISHTSKPVRNIMLYTAWHSQGNPFHVLRPWDGQAHNGLKGARPVNVTGAGNAPGQPMPTPADAAPPSEIEGTS